MPPYRRFLALALSVSAFGACESITVIAVAVNSVEISPPSLTLLEDEARDLNTVLRGPEGQALGGRTVTWSSDAPAIAAVDGTGRVTGGVPGQTAIRASAEGRSAAIPVTILLGQSIDLSTRDVEFSAFSGESSETVNIDIANGGNGVLSGLSLSVSYALGQPQGWLTAGLNGTTAPASATLSASALGLPEGEYTATLSVQSPARGGLSETVMVSFMVMGERPLIVLEPDGVAFGAVENGQQPAVGVVQVTNGGGSILTGLGTVVQYGAGQPQGWLDILLDSVTAPATMTLSASPGGLPAGVYQATVLVSADLAINTPVALEVTFTVAPAAPASARRVRGSRASVLVDRHAPGARR